MDQFLLTEGSANNFNLQNVFENRQALLQQILGQVVAIPGMTQELTSKFLDLYRQFEGLLLATPVPGLVFRYGGRIAQVNFHSILNVGKNDSGHICVHHLWKGDCGFVLVEDVFSFFRSSKIFRHGYNKSPLVRRRTTLLSNEKEKLYSQPMMYEIISRAGRLMMGTSSGSLLSQDRVCFYIERVGFMERFAEDVNFLFPEEQKIDAGNNDHEDILSDDDSMFGPRIIQTPATSSAAESDEFTIHTDDNSDQDDVEEDQYSNDEDEDAQDDANTNHAIHLVATLRTRLDNVAARERDVEDREATLKTDTAALERQKIDQENILAARAAAIEKQKIDQETALATRAITLTRRGMDRENALAARTRELERHEIDTGIELAARERAIAYHERGLGPMPDMPHEPDANYCAQFRKGQCFYREENMAGAQMCPLAEQNPIVENEVNKLLEMIKIHPFFGKLFLQDSFVNQSENIKPLLLASPEPSLIFRFGLESRDVTFVRNPGFEPMMCSLVARRGLVLMVQTYNKTVVLFSNGSASLKHVPVKSVQTLLKSKKSFRQSSKIFETSNAAKETQSTLNTTVDNHEKSMRCLVDCNDSTAHNKILQVAKGGNSEAGLLLAVKIPHAAKSSQNQESHLMSRKVNLQELEHSYAIRNSALEERESIMEMREADYRSRYAYYEKLFAAMRINEDGFTARESAVTERENIANELEKTLRDRIHSLEIDEEVQALKASERNEALKTRNHCLHEREELVVLGRSVMRARESHVTRREYLIEIRDKKLEDVEQTFLASEATVKAIETVLNLRESAVKASEDAVNQRENAVKSEKATLKHDREALELYESNLRYTEERLQKKDEKLNWEFTNREVLVIEREQKIEAIEGASKMGWVIPGIVQR
ncbi:hypothetical protein BTUL_0121g00080 [Botrytis tulipae]|uniref:Uncharacterized protein n=1 Tax=Botrytis tulipae TaxID=87230 RepID=A0A4Z1EF04_9HELO|nr:hypothetical protein BTUL_0121g00080 [Botrytis tulipae]